ncbi:fluoride efflux transporter FluC [Levilactobacillus acidifarinae]|uniref:fluoride efflux transporter FluC n=1 Tax=Levilactobacillus acidifarinae TaxID=267364 RepID=UPI00071021A6|nr:CrcB family protein [Levilactobacillus acidifarinae]GEO70812.1 putative fluoride ion transporter CrcB 2 [Levilactobacillus acidifarinae]
MKKIGLIFICAFLGSALRLSLTAWTTPHHYLTILTINVIGSFGLPLITGALPLLWPVSPAMVTGLSVGLVGSFTTFSTFTVDAVSLLHQHAAWLAGGYVLGSLVFGWSAAAAGITLSARLVKRGRRA